MKNKLARQSSDSLLDHIFAPFTQADSTVTRKYGGTGLGLTICHRLVSMMGGKIWFASNSGLGSQFYFIIPLSVAPPADTTLKITGENNTLARNVEAMNAESGRQHLRILLAEDNRVNQVVAQRLLEKMGHSVVLANNGKEALSLLERHPFDLVLMDVQMPELDGLETTVQIRCREKRLSAAPMPIIAMTAHAMKGDRERCLASGMDGYISKPVTTSELAEAIRRLPGGGNSESSEHHT